MSHADGVATEPQREETRLPALVERARALVATQPRVLLGVAGAPGAGKSTLAHKLVAALGDRAHVVSMDGFHLCKARLVELGRRERMGAIDTFDAAGFVALLQRLRLAGDAVVYAPEFRRELEEPIAGAVAIDPSVRLVVVEGNYLLADAAPWDGVRDLLDEAWYCEPDEQVRVSNLISRHRAFGKSDADARRWALGPDERNAELVRGTRARADLIVRLAR